MFHHLYYPTECVNPSSVGVDDSTKVLNSQLTASSSLSNYRDPWGVRITKSNNAYWATAMSNPENPWIQVDFLNPVAVTIITTQGSNNQNPRDVCFVDTLQVQYGNEEDALVYIVESNGSPKASIDSCTI